MCGIIGYSGAEYAREKLLHGLENLEYRGYDSAGIALWDEGKIEVIKAAGRLSNLRAACGDQWAHPLGHPWRAQRCECPPPPAGPCDAGA